MRIRHNTKKTDLLKQSIETNIYMELHTIYNTLLSL